ncbi:MAG: GLPGLI family protein, partial [Chitinophagaceae bacterium]
FLYGEALFSSFYFWEEDKPVFNWKVEYDTMNIDGLLCQKAIARYKGRDWEAWFCSSLPFPTGPWKFNGLPGLIINIRDSKNQVYYKFTGVVSMGEKLVAIPNKAVKTTQNEFTKVKTAALENPESFMNSSGAFKGTLKLSGIPINSKPTNIPNNKIELE